MQPVHKATVKAAIRNQGTWTGYIAPNKVSAFHITGGWHIGCKITVTTLEELEDVVDNFSYYNCNSELGQRVRFWA
jgi:ribosomal protein L5